MIGFFLKARETYARKKGLPRGGPSPGSGCRGSAEVPGSALPAWGKPGGVRSSSWSLGSLLSPFVPGVGHGGA